MGRSHPIDAELKNDMSLLSSDALAFIQSDQKMLIGSELTVAQSGKSFDVLDPTSGSVIARVPEGDSADIDKAVIAARDAFDNGEWSKMKPASRERLVFKLADLIEKNAEELSNIESLNSGRTLMNTRAFDVDLSADYLRYMGGWATKIHGQTLTPSVPYVPGADFFSFTLREPVGVVAAITPWNVPLGQAIWKIAPALSTGCTLVLKPAEQTPLTALRLGQLIQEAGIPPGVVNIVTGFGDKAGAALVDHPLVDKVAFTGSTETGRSIAAKVASSMKRMTLELGGKSAMLVFNDADLDSTISGTAMGIFGNHGQNCCAGSRLYVQNGIYEELVEGVVKFAEGIRLGSALQKDTEMGPLISLGQQKRVLGYIESGITDGAELLTGGHAVTQQGAYVKPTVLGNVSQSMTVVQEEIFGPVLVVIPFNDAEQAIQLANDTQYGLGASIWTQNLQNAHRLIPKLKSGTVWVNTHNILDMAVPFGGLKASGIGRELGEEAVLHHTEVKSVTMAL